MEKNVEVELKFQVLDEPHLADFLKNLKFIDEKRNIDIYLDAKDGDLYKKGIFIRVRDNRKLDFKFNLTDFQNQVRFGKHEHCDELSFPLPLANNSIEPINKICRTLGLKGITTPDLEEFKIKNNLIESVVIHKIRQKFTDGKFEFSFDNVNGLGKFIEIELLASKEENLEEIKEEMRERIRGLRLKLITTGYNEVYQRKHNFNLYLQGRYLFEEDYGK